MRSYLTIFAMLEANPELFSGLALPEGLDAETLTDYILMECSEMEVVYPNPQTMQALIGVWSRARIEVWEKLLETTQYEYDPIYNYDRHFTATDTMVRDYSEDRTSRETGDRKDNRSSEDSSGRDTSLEGTHASKTTGTTVNSGSDVTSREKAAFNAGMQADSKDTVTLGSQVKTDGTVDSSDTEMTSEAIIRQVVDDFTSSNTVDGQGSTDGDEHSTNTHTERGYGNIGVTTTQQMIEQERAVVQYSLYSVITTEFRERFCILIY